MRDMAGQEDSPFDSGRRGFTLALAGAAASTLPALRALAADASGLYTIEIVIFRNGGAAAGEDLAAAAARNAGADNDSGGSGSMKLGELLPASRHKLNDVVGRLNASGGHKVLAHVAWTQTAGSWNSQGGIGADQLGLSAAGFTGAVQLERGLYLHLGFNLQYNAGATKYALSELRRVKFNERNYYDHPALGIVAVVTPGGATP
jgi:hypothetical protein